MPQSRKRPNRNHSSARSRRGSGHPGRRASQSPRTQRSDLPGSSDFADYSERLNQSARAELAGDAAEAFALYCVDDCSEHSPHGTRLGMLAALGDRAPAWLISRWLTVQARWVAKDASARAVDRWARQVYVDEQVPEGTSGYDFVAMAHEFDWVLRQLTVYDEGGLRDTAHQAQISLAGCTDHIVEWAQARMGGWRVEGIAPEGLTFTDLATGEPVRLLDLGLAEKYDPGQCFVGRVVPISVAPGRMFEWMPLEADEMTARQVATCEERDASEDWLDVLCRREREGALPPVWSRAEFTASMLGDFELEAVLGLMSEQKREMVMDWPEERCHLGALAMLCCEDILRVVPSHPDVIEHLPWLLSVTIAETMNVRGRAVLAIPEFHDGWVALAEGLPEPAGSICAELAVASMSRRRQRGA